jgi:hypothetical protein
MTIDDAYAANKDRYEARDVRYNKYYRESLMSGGLEVPVSDAAYTGKPIINNGQSHTSCTKVHPPLGTSVTTHDVYINGVYEDQTDHERSHTRGVAQQLTHDSDTLICAAWRQARSYNFTYEIKAFKK